MMWRRIVYMPLLALFGILVAGPLGAQSASEVIREAVEAYEERMEEVDQYYVVQTVMGRTDTIHFVREIVDGRPVFRPTVPEGTATGPEGTATVRTDREWASPYEAFSRFAERATLEGTEVVDGHECHVVSITDFSGDDFGAPSVPDQAGAFQGEKATFHLDVDEHIVRRMVMEGRLERNGEQRPIRVRADMKDYRAVEGVVHPFLMEVTVEGLSGQLSDEDVRQARESLEQLRERMEQMDDRQRAMMEGMMKPQIERLEEILASGSLQLEVRVENLVVNEAPPGSR